jgi:hypothetical protein
MRWERGEKEMDSRASESRMISYDRDQRAEDKG